MLPETMKVMKMARVKNPIAPVILGSIYLLIYTLILHLTNWTNLVFILYFLSPFVVIWMVLKVLKGRGPSVEKPFPYD